MEVEDKKGKRYLFSLLDTLYTKVQKSPFQLSGYSWDDSVSVRK